MTLQWCHGVHIVSKFKQGKLCSLKGGVTSLQNLHTGRGHIEIQHCPKAQRWVAFFFPCSKGNINRATIRNPICFYFCFRNSSSVSSDAAGKMWRCSSFLCSVPHSKKKVVVWILSAVSRIYHRLSTCVCLPGLAALPWSMRMIHAYHKALRSAASVRCASGAAPSGGKGSSAKTGMRLKGCTPEVQRILIWLGACQSSKLVGIFIIEYFFIDFSSMLA